MHLLVMKILPLVLRRLLLLPLLDGVQVLPVHQVLHLTLQVVPVVLVPQVFLVVPVVLVPQVFLVVPVVLVPHARPHLVVRLL